MEISFLPVDLARWDQAPAGDVLAVGVWADARPPRGAAGVIDWRLCGALSDALLHRGDRHFDGAYGERLVLPTPRLAWREVLAIGLGAAGEFSEERYRGSLRALFEEARRARAAKIAVALPGRDAGRISPERAFELLLTVADQERSAVAEPPPAPPDDPVPPEAESAVQVAHLTIIDTPGAAKAMADLVTRSSWARLAAPKRPTVHAPVP